MLDVMVNINNWTEDFGFATCVDQVHLACLQNAVYVQSQVQTFIPCPCIMINEVLLMACKTSLGGAMKPTTDGRWAHLACAIWIPGNHFTCPNSS